MALEDEVVYRGCVNSARLLRIASHWPCLSLRTSFDGGQGMGWSRPRSHAPCLSIEDHLPQGTQRARRILFPKEIPESGNKRGKVSVWEANRKCLLQLVP